MFPIRWMQKPQPLCSVVGSDSVLINKKCSCLIVGVMRFLMNLMTYCLWNRKILLLEHQPREMLSIMSPFLHGCKNSVTNM